MELTSSKPKKQRKWHYTKALHIIQKDFGIHLSPGLRKSLGKRSLETRKGDTVKILRGNKSFVGKQGEITAVRRNKRQVLIEGITRKRVDGTEIQVPFRPSNLILISLKEGDKKRIKNTKLAKQKTVTEENPTSIHKGEGETKAEATTKVSPEGKKEVKETKEEKVKKDGE